MLSERENHPIVKKLEELMLVSAAEVVEENKDFWTNISESGIFENMCHLYDALDHEKL
jgi:predicted transcriptional regulator